jgi:hypothetical protein
MEAWEGGEGSFIFRSKTVLCKVRCLASLPKIILSLFDGVVGQCEQTLHVSKHRIVRRRVEFCGIHALNEKFGEIKHSEPDDVMLVPLGCGLEEIGEQQSVVCD